MPSNTVSCFLLALFVAGVAAIAPARVAAQPPDPEGRTEPERESEEPREDGATGLQGAPALDLTLRDAIATALASNLNIRAERLLAQTSALDVMASYGIFDPILFSNLNHTDFEEPTSSALDTGGNQVGVVTGKQTSFSVGIRRRFFTGLDAEVRLDQNRSFNDRAFELLNPSYRTSMGITITQPVLRGAGPGNVLSDVRIAKTNLRIADEALRQTIEEIVFQVVQAYWELSFADQDIRVKRESLELAENEVRITESKVRLGLVPQLELDQALTEQYSRRADLVQAETAFEDAMDILRRLMFPLDDRVEWTIRLRTTDDLKEVDLADSESWIDEQSIPAWEDTIAEALSMRPEVRQAQLDLRNKELEITRLANETLPTLDLTGSYTWADLNDEADEGLRDVYFADPRTWTAGFVFEFPLGNRGARALVRKARIEKRRLHLLLRETENTVVAEVREALRGIDSALERIRYTHRALVSAEKQLQAAASRRDRGFLTNFEVLEFQRDLAQADQNLNDAWKEYRVALASLERAKGALLPRLGIEFDPEEGNP